jgi:Xaa-Pro aminopeptidase
MIDYRNRLRKVRAHMREMDADAFILKNGGNIRYLSCSHVPTFAMLTYLVVTKRRTIGITSTLEEFRAKEQAACDTLKIFGPYDGIPRDGPSGREVLKQVISKYELKNVLMDSKERFHGVKVTGDDHIEALREVKDDYEMAQIRKAVRITKKVGEKLPEIIVPGKTENQAAVDLDHELRSAGGTALSFTTIVASGRKNSAYSHHDVTTRKIGKADAVVVDFGIFINGYCSDISRTLLMPNAPPKLRKVYDAVEVAQRIGIQTVAEGVPYCAIEAAIRESLKPDYDRYFVHSTGHGFGLEVHERPWLRIITPKKDVVRKGNTFTVEPGVYIPGVGGVRIEDDIHVGDNVKVL